MVDDLNRVMGAKVAPLLRNGGALALYDVEVGKLMPRPIGVVAVPADRRAEFASFVDMARQA